MAKKLIRRAPARDVVLENLKGFVRKGSDMPEEEFISTGHLSLDLAIAHGINPDKADLTDVDIENPGGFPLGKLAEVYGSEGSGKSSIGYRVCGYAQKLGYACLWIDAENSFSHDLAEINGVNLDELHLSTLYDEDDPDKMFYAEDIMESICVACKSGIQVIVLDSIAALTTKAEMENEIGQGGVGMGALAQLLSRSVKKVCNYAAKYHVLVIMINQVREKIGVLFGCFSGDTLVSFADGSRIPISEVVKKKMTGPVLSYNAEKKSVEIASIVDWHRNGQLDNDEKWLHFLCDGPGTKNGRLGFHCTENHVLFNEYGEEISASDVVEGDYLLSYREHQLLNDNVHREIIYGSLLGDGHVNVRSESTACFRLSNSDYYQQEYVGWKMRMLPMLSFTKVESCGRIRWDSNYSVEMKTIKDYFYQDSTGYRRVPEDITLTELMAAIWYQDDGSLKDDGRPNPTASISIKRMANDPEQIALTIELFEKWQPKLIGHVSYSDNQKSIVFDIDGSDKLFSAIAPFVHFTMNYKIPPKYHTIGKMNVVSKMIPAKMVPYKAKVLKISTGSDRSHRNKTKYDITVAGNSTYMVGGGTGIVVHNSPETTPGGRAVRFHSSIRLRLEKQSSKDGSIYSEGEGGEKNLIAGKSYVQIKKNRFGKPVRDDAGKDVSLLLPIYYENYFPDIEDVLFDQGRLLNEIGSKSSKIVKVRNNLYSWGDIKATEPGKSGFVKALKDADAVDDLVETIRNAATEAGVLLPPEVLKYQPTKKKKTEKAEKVEKDDGKEAKVSGRRKSKDSDGGEGIPVVA